MIKNANIIGQQFALEMRELLVKSAVDPAIPAIPGVPKAPTATPAPSIPQFQP